jgi:hypothetical protein
MTRVPEPPVPPHQRAWRVQVLEGHSVPGGCERVADTRRIHAASQSPDPLGDVHELDDLHELVDRIPARYLRRIRGRESFEGVYRGARVVVKRFRGGEPRDWWSERARGLALRSPARTEAENLLALRALGLPVPEPLAWAEETRARWNAWRGRGRSVCVQRWVEHAQTLAERAPLAAVPERRRLARELGGLVGRMHAAGWCHRDLYLEHFLVTATGLVLIDLGRARRGRPLARRWLVKDLAALAMSCPAGIDRRTRCLVLAHWRREQSGVRRRAGAAALTAAIEAKARRLAAHVPKYAYDRAEQRASSRDGAT